MLKVLSNILCDLDPKVKVIGQKAGICDGVPSTSALVNIIQSTNNYIIVSSFICWNQNIVHMKILDTSFKLRKRRFMFRW